MKRQRIVGYSHTISELVMPNVGSAKKVGGNLLGIPVITCLNWLYIELDYLQT